jgi:hypothetical protein
LRFEGAAKVAIVLAGVSASASGYSFGIFANTGLQGGARWDAGSRQYAGFERSLEGGLRFSLQGGSYQAFRDQFTWAGGAPTLGIFQQSVDRAFEQWRRVDPTSGLGTTVSFTPDFGTPVDATVQNGVRFGAEIDIMAATSASTWGNGSAGLQGEAWFNAFFENVTLTSGTTNYAAAAISGADIWMNSNVQALWTLPIFEAVLTHEVGHALGFLDVDLDAGPNGRFIDDNFNGANGATALATLTNSFAHLINPLNPSLSPLAMYTVANGDPGFDTNGVEIMMESQMSNYFFGNPNMMQNDEFAGRQFLYPVVPVPEPATLAILGLGGLALLRKRTKRV